MKATLTVLGSRASVAPGRRDEVSSELHVPSHQPAFFLEEFFFFFLVHLVNIVLIVG